MDIVFRIILATLLSYQINVCMGRGMALQKAYYLMDGECAGRDFVPIDRLILDKWRIDNVHQMQPKLSVYRVISLSGSSGARRPARLPVRPSTPLKQCRRRAVA